MAGDAAQRIWSAVQKKALLRITGKLAAAEACAYAIAALQGSACRIKIRIVYAVPETDIFKKYFRLRVAVFRGNGDQSALRR